MLCLINKFIPETLYSISIDYTREVQWYTAAGRMCRHQDTKNRVTCAEQPFREKCSGKAMESEVMNPLKDTR